MPVPLPEGVQSALEATPGVRFVLLNAVVLLLLAFREVSLTSDDVDDDLLLAIYAAVVPLLLAFGIVVVLEVVALL